MKKQKIILQTALVLLQTLTGILLVGFSSFHLLGNSVINFGEDWMNFYISHLDKTNIFIKIAIWFLAAAILAHGLNGLRVVFRYFKKTQEIPGFLIESRHRGSFLWYVHFSTGILIAIFLTIHLLIAYFGAKESITTVEIIKIRLQNNYYFALMNLLLIAGVFHACYGVRTIFVKYGFLVEHQRKINVIILIIGVISIILGLNNLILYR